jgi:hypothetical protein
MFFAWKGKCRSDKTVYFVWLLQKNVLFFLNGFELLEEFNNFIKFNLI